jgi:hypothetical protein
MKRTQIVRFESDGTRGHAPARHLYDKAGYVPMPIVRYFKAL